MKQTKIPPLFIKAWRERAGYRNTDLAEKLDVSPSQLAQWESGFRTPTRQTQANIAAALGVDYLSLYHLPVKKDQPNEKANRNRPASNKSRSRM